VGRLTIQLPYDRSDIKKELHGTQKPRHAYTCKPGLCLQKQAARLAANCMARKNYVILQQEHKQIAKYG
jgi:hypothetical protein